MTIHGCYYQNTHILHKHTNTYTGFCPGLFRGMWEVVKMGSDKHTYNIFPIKQQHKIQ